MLLLKGSEDFFSPSLSFLDVWDRMKPWCKAKGILPTIKRKRGKYKTRKKSKGMHASSEVMVQIPPAAVVPPAAAAPAANNVA